MVVARLLEPERIIAEVWPMPKLVELEPSVLVIPAKLVPGASEAVVHSGP